MKGPNGYQKREAARLARLKRADKAYAKYLKQFGMELGAKGEVVIKLPILSQPTDAEGSI